METTLWGLLSINRNPVDTKQIMKIEKKLNKLIEKLEENNLRLNQEEMKWVKFFLVAMDAFVGLPNPDGEKWHLLPSHLSIQILNNLSRCKTIEDIEILYNDSLRYTDGLSRLKNGDYSDVWGNK